MSANSTNSAPGALHLSVRRALEGRRILITGASGFLGKVWLCHLLRDLPELDRVWVILRPGRAPDAHRRLEGMLAGDPAFRPLFVDGADPGATLGGRLGALDGDVTKPLCGLCPDVVDRLDLDLVVHLAGLTNLDPDLEDALAANVDGALNALELARRTGARLVHVSTAYVAGHKRGAVSEALRPNAVPGDDPEFSARQELSDLRALTQRVRGEAHDQQQARAFRTRARELTRCFGGGEEELFERERECWIRSRLADEAAARARRWGWPNAYTLTKSLAESLLIEERGDVPVWIVRPTVVESALAFPFPGWKEGLQTSAPLTYALTHGPLRGLPSRTRLALDVIPVDLVARGLSLISAGLLEAEAPAPRAFHLGSSDRNPLPMERVIELTSLAHREHEGLGKGKLTWRSLLPDAVPTSLSGYERTSVPLLRRLAQRAGALLEISGDVLPNVLPERLTGDLAARARKLARSADRTERRLELIEEVVERFLPFVLENDCVFEAGGVRELEARLDPTEQAEFSGDPKTLDWRRYWIDVHIPGLRMWIYPRLEGRRAPKELRRALVLERLEVPGGVRVS